MTRDFVGYGPTSPHANWPGGAQIAVNFVIDFDEGSELSQERVWICRREDIARHWIARHPAT